MGTHCSRPRQQPLLLVRQPQGEGPSAACWRLKGCTCLRSGAGSPQAPLPAAAHRGQRAVPAAGRETARCAERERGLVLLSAADAPAALVFSARSQSRRLPCNLATLQLRFPSGKGPVSGSCSAVAPRDPREHLTSAVCSPLPSLALRSSSPLFVLRREARVFLRRCSDWPLGSPACPQPGPWGALRAGTRSCSRDA